MKNEELITLMGEGRYDTAFETLAQPLHERLYAAQNFDIINEFSPLERATITFDYVNMQVSQGGFIQFIQNGYISILVPLIESLQELAITPNMVQVLDDVLKVYVLNREILDKETSVQEFANLYNEFAEFEALELRFNEAAPATITALLSMAIKPA